MRIGIDLGGSKTELIALDAQGRTALRFRRPTPAGDYHASVQLIVNMIHEAESQLNTQASIGIGTPGAVSRSSGCMKNCNSTCLNGQPLLHDLEHALQRTIRIDNDANCFALSEASDGAGRDARVLFGIILGTGVGGGLVINKQVFGGANSIAGEWGHNPLAPAISTGIASEWPGPACYCGRHGCIETWLSGPAMQAAHRQQYGMNLSASAIAAAAENGDVNCMQTIERYCHQFARALASIINIIDPDIIVLGGGLSNIDRLYHRVPQLWQQYIFSDDVRTILARPQYGDSSGVRGAAWLWENRK